MGASFISTSFGDLWLDLIPWAFGNYNLQCHGDVLGSQKVEGQPNTGNPCRDSIDSYLLSTTRQGIY